MSAHVVVDARMIHDGGIGTYLRNVVPRVARARPQWRWTALGDHGELERARWTSIAGMTAVHCDTPVLGAREQLELPPRIPADANVLWAPHYNVPMLALRPRLVVTIHDVAHVARPDVFGLGPAAYARVLLWYVRARASRVIFDTEFSRAEMGRLIGDVGARGAVAHLAADDAWSASRAVAAPMDGPYFIYLGNLKLHKNVPLLLRAFRRVCDRIPHRLVLMGRRERVRVDPLVAREIAALGDRVVDVGETTPDVAYGYVANATALVTASLYEGFGLPPLEAMAAGCPCVVSRAGSLPEVCGDAALYCDPTDESDVAAAMLRVATDRALRDDLIARGRARAHAFSWDRCADITAGAIDLALA